MISLLRTSISLGLISTLRLLTYKVRIKFNLIPFFKKKHSLGIENIEKSIFFKKPNFKKDLLRNTSWDGKQTFFGKHVFYNSDLPNWHLNIFDNLLSPSEKPSLEISDFNDKFGDIKSIWEPSRLDWVICKVQKILKDGKKEDLNSLNLWLKIWIKENPAFYGVNWKCGQEASIRVIHLALGSLMLGQEKNTSSDLLSLVELHLNRIRATLNYGIGQDNNHGTTEASALYIGGVWLEHHDYKSGKRFKNLGIKWLENRVKKLVLEDGTFSQYSTNYHRLFLDTCAFNEIWKNIFNQPSFSNTFYKRLKAATYWLYQFVDSSGYAPNLGANDGTLLLPMTDSDYNDYRSSVATSSALFLKKSIFSDTKLVQDHLRWLGLDFPKEKISRKKTKVFIKGGMINLLKEPASIFFRIPIFKFRPIQADALHIDFWLEGRNIFRDGGTFSYNCNEEMMDYFSGVESHNTIQFDNKNQMEKITRFLYKDWLKIDKLEQLKESENEFSFGAGYKKKFKEMHYRKIELKQKNIKIKDTFSGFKNNAILRWRLEPGKWKLEENKLYSENRDIKITLRGESKKIKLSFGDESRYYMHKDQIPVLEIHFSTGGDFTTEIDF